MATYKATVELDWPAEGSPGVNVFHFRSEGGGLGETGVQEIIDDLQVFYQAIAGVYPEGMTIVMPDQIIKDPYGSPEYETVDGWVVSGTGTQGFAPLATALTCSWRTTSATRSGRGRTFIGPLALYCVDADGTPKSDVLGIVRAAAGALCDTSRGYTQASLGVYSTSQGVLRDWQSSNVRDTFSVLRSRRD